MNIGTNFGNITGVSFLGLNLGAPALNPFVPPTEPQRVRVIPWECVKGLWQPWHSLYISLLKKKLQDESNPGNLI